MQGGLSRSRRPPPRPLLPAVAGMRRQTTEPPPKKQRIATACEACRARKTKCNGNRPKCTSCITRATDCVYGETESRVIRRKYEDLRSRQTKYKELFNLIKSVSAAEAHEIITRLRSGAGVETLLDHVAAGDVLLQLAVTPETRYRYDFPYINKMPEDLATSSNPYLQSTIYESAALYPASRQSVTVGDSSRHPSTDSVTRQRPQLKGIDLANYSSLYMKPFHAAVVIDPLLSDVKISSWTSVCADDALMRNLLSGWLLCEYQYTAAFQKGLFLQDMAAQRDDFCSSLLVNIVLAYSCLCYPRFANRAEYWNPETLTYRFVAEAKRLWELESDKPRITTVQAGILLNVFYNLSGLDLIGKTYMARTLALAEDMRLFKRDTDGTSTRDRHGLSYTAWALFNWETLVSFALLLEPVLSDPPEWQLPDPIEKPNWYGEIWVRYPLDERSVQLHFGEMIKARSDFRVIMNEACRAVFSKNSRITLDKANEFYSRLEGWHKRLSGILSSKYIVLPTHLQLHMYYQHLILTIFEPFLDIETNQNPSLYQVVTDTRIRLQTLVRLYYLRHGYEAMDVFIVVPLMLHAYKCIDAFAAVDEQTPIDKLEALRSTLILVTKGLYTQRQNHYLAEALFRVVRGRMQASEVALFRGILNMDERMGDGKLHMVQAVRSHWPVSIVRKEDIDSYTLTNLVERYANLNVEVEGVWDDLG